MKCEICGKETEVWMLSCHKRDAIWEDYALCPECFVEELENDNVPTVWLTDDKLGDGE